MDRVDLDEHRAAARGLDCGVAIEPAVDGELLEAQTVQRLDVGHGRLEEGELVAFEVLAQGEAEHRLRLEPAPVQQLDPEIDVAVGLRPGAVLGVERMRGGRRCRGGIVDEGEGGRHRS